MPKFCKHFKLIDNWKLIVLTTLCTLALISALLIEKNKTIAVPGLGLIKGCTTSSAWTGRVIYQFLGIPFAESPSGKLRFKPPVARSKWIGVLDATQYGQRCPVKGLHFPNHKDDVEDCLNLCVYTTSLIARNPVMIYIHGGGFYNGSASQYKPNFLLERNIVLVVPQYRLGVLGFLSTNSEEIPGNMAAVDIILALKWVQKYISHFGGDPSQVTLFGQSAGAALVNTVMISPAVPQGLFHRTIVQSGTVIAGWGAQPYSFEIAENVCNRAECPNCKEIKEINKCLIELDIIKLLDISTGDSLRTKDSYALVIGDYNDILPRWPNELMENGSKYPMIAGFTKHDGSFVLAAVYDTLKQMVGDFKKMHPRQFIQELVKLTEKDTSGTITNMAIKLLFNKKDIENRNYTKLIPELIDLTSIITIKSPALTLAMLNKKSNPHSTYLYTFDYEGLHTHFGYGADTSHYPFNGGVHHSNDCIYLFATHSLNKNDTEVAKIMVDLWTSFATTGKPESKNFNKWRPINETGPYLHINFEGSIGNDFFDEFLSTVNDETGSIVKQNKEF